jgi:uncharacterized protein
LGIVAPTFDLDGGVIHVQQPVWLFLVDIPAKSVLFTWFFLHTRGSVLLAMLLHGATNLFVVSPDLSVTGDLMLPLIAVTAKWMLVVVLVVVAGPKLVRGSQADEVTSVRYSR